MKKNLGKWAYTKDTCDPYWQNESEKLSTIFILFFCDGDLHKYESTITPSSNPGSKK